MPVARIRNHSWLMENVVPSLPGIEFGDGSWSLDKSHPDVKSKAVIAAEVAKFIVDSGPDVELWAYYGSYDHVALSQLWGRMIDHPPGVPMWTRELMQFWEEAGKPIKPADPAGEHNALIDARWNRDLWIRCS